MEPYAHQRLGEEMGFDCEFKYIKAFHYSVDFQDGMIENEIDHIYLGFFEGIPSPDSMEVCDWKWIGIKELKEDVLANPNLYTYWFRFIVENHLNAIENLI